MNVLQEWKCVEYRKQDHYVTLVSDSFKWTFECFNLYETSESTTQNMNHYA